MARIITYTLTTVKSRQLIFEVDEATQTLNRARAYYERRDDQGRVFDGGEEIFWPEIPDPPVDEMGNVLPAVPDHWHKIPATRLAQINAFIADVDGVLDRLVN